MGAELLNTRFPGSLCLPRYMRDTAYTYKKILYVTVKLMYVYIAIL